MLESWQEAFDDAVTARTAQPEAGPADPSLWRSVDRLIAGAIASRGGDLDGVLAHKVGPLAAGWYERSQTLVPHVLHEEQRAASLGVLLAPTLVQRIRDAVEGELVLLKGPEVAARYPPGGRRFSDVDVLVRDADAAQAALMRAGFVEADEGVDLDDHHHLHPLRYPAIWLSVEVHSAPNWPVHHTAAPPVEEVFEAAVPSVLQIDGVSAPTPLHHALLLAAHAWRHQPLHLLRDLLDVAALADGVPAAELQLTAERWGVGRLWRTTWAAAEALFYGSPDPLPFKLWARHLRPVRPQTVLEEHLQRWLHPFWEQPFGRALGDSLRMIGSDVTPAAGQTWGAKLTQSADALLHLRSPAASRDRFRP